MITSDEYRVEIFKIIGFVLMTPFGNLIISVPKLTLLDLNIKLFTYFLVTLLLLYLGIIIISRNYEVIRSKEKR